ncbi:DNA polymerase [Salinicola sp. CR57]|uniref:DNA polymerase n=1 Tax=Salinicola sp. CR57 TaxID=1949086 RepID=UPI000DA20E03|nr:DNA polymerase [Salinicola sp. CR57]
MIESPWRVLLFTKDYTSRGLDRFYWYVDHQLVETEADEVTRYSGSIVCHDFWLIRDSLFEKSGRLPNLIIDLDEFRIATSGIPDDRLVREKQDITAWLEQSGAEQEICSAYRKMFNKALEFDPEVAKKIAIAFEEMFVHLLENAKALGEAERFFDIEAPVYRLLQNAMAGGIRIENDRLSEMRKEAEYNFFNRLKEYSDKHDMPLETPSKKALEKKLIAMNYELDDVSVDYLLEYVPHELDFGSDTIKLQESDDARRVLGSLTLSTRIIRPVLDVFGSRTSRIHLRSPNLQNIPKKYRGIIGARNNGKICYVDFDQYEVGIMAALSQDQELMRLYAEGDMYDHFAIHQLNLPGNRKAAKQLFLSYAYGMSKKALIDAAVSFGVDRSRAKAAFGVFKQYENWKKSIWDDFQAHGRISTLFGNHFVRNRLGALSVKEKRSAVSQVVQGTASLIFKKALLAVGELEDVTIILPMHDALLFEHTAGDTPTKVIAAFEQSMTTVLEGRVKGKASVGAFFAD